ncbi:MAG TPA: hypothetical protein VKA86_03555 [Candidatus Krumholzibacteria bacterium]|nr:hypothetical protein [Candidatus Krumholzibacteria bacterium]
MMMRVLQIHPDTEVFQEHPDSAAFHRYCLRDLETLDHLVIRSRAPVVCFKPLMDSYRAGELLEHFAESRVLWMLRHYTDVANSTLHRFADPNVNLRRILEGQPGGDHMRREISGDSLAAMHDLYRSDLTEADLACLRWWGRNRIVLEQGLHEHPRLRLQPYEDLVESGRPGVNEILTWAGLEPSAHAVRHVHARSVGRNPAPDLAPEVHELCEDLHRALTGIAVKTVGAR